MADQPKLLAIAGATGYIGGRLAPHLISEGYAVKSYPNLYVIDQNGTIAAVHVGFGDDSLVEIIEDINKLLTAPPKPVPAQA